MQQYFPVNLLIREKKVRQEFGFNSFVWMNKRLAKLYWVFCLFILLKLFLEVSEIRMNANKNEN